MHKAVKHPPYPPYTHHIRVFPQAVGDQEGLPPALLVLLEHGHHARIRDDVGPRVLRHSVLDDPVAVTQVHALADVRVDGGVGVLDLARVPVLVLDQLGEEVGVHEEEESVDVHKRALGI